MKDRKLSILIAFMVLLLASLACNAVTGGGNDNNNNGFSFTTANIKNAHLSGNIDDTEPVTGYSSSAPTFYCFFDLNNAPDDTVVKGVWTLISAEGFQPNSEIDSVENTGGDGTYYFTLDRSGDAWPVGKYKIDLYIDGKPAQSIAFDVK